MRFLFALTLLLCPLLALAQPSAPAGGPSAHADVGSPALAPAAPVVASEELPAFPAPGSLDEIPGVVVSGPPSALVLVSAPAPEPPSAPDALPRTHPLEGSAMSVDDVVPMILKAPVSTSFLTLAIILGISLARWRGWVLTSDGVRVVTIGLTAVAGAFSAAIPALSAWIAMAPTIAVGVHQTFVKPVTKKKG